jgi:hypothetical protein
VRQTISRVRAVTLVFFLVGSSGCARTSSDGPAAQVDAARAASLKTLIDRIDLA